MRIKDKIEQIKRYLDELEQISPNNFEDYDIKTCAACERYFEKIVEAAVDLSYLVIKKNQFKVPEEANEAFDILVKEKIISKELATRLKEAKGMRNLISHQYGNIDDKIVFKSITEELPTDIKNYINIIKTKFNREYLY